MLKLLANVTYHLIVGFALTMFSLVFLINVLFFLHLYHGSWS